MVIKFQWLLVIMLCYVQVIFTAYSMSLVIVSRDANYDDGLSHSPMIYSVSFLPNLYAPCVQYLPAFALKMTQMWGTIYHLHRAYPMTDPWCWYINANIKGVY